MILRASSAIVAVTAMLVVGRAALTRVGILGAADRYGVGDVIALPDEPSPDTGAAVVVFGRSSCGAWQAAAGEVRRLSDAVLDNSAAGLHVLIDAAGVEDAAGALPGAQVRPVRLRDYRLRSVPTILVVDSRRRITFIQEGVTSESVDAALRALDRTRAAPPTE